MRPINEITRVCGEALAALDALAAEMDDPIAEDLEDMNAELEDALAMLGEFRPGDDADELADALEDVRALAGDYRALTAKVPALAPLCDRLERALGGAGD